MVKHRFSFVGFPRSKTAFAALLNQSLLVFQGTLSALSSFGCKVLAIRVQRSLSGITVVVACFGAVSENTSCGLVLLEKHLELLICKGLPVRVCFALRKPPEAFSQLFYPELTECFFFSRATPRAYFFSCFLKVLFEADPRHVLLFKKVEASLHELFYSRENLYVSGIFLRVSGRLGGADRSRVFSCFFGRLPRQSFGQALDFGHSEALTPFGVFGIRVFFFVISYDF